MSDITNYDRLKAKLCELVWLAPNTPSYVEALRQAERYAELMQADFELENTRKSYSELIIEGNEAKKTCGQCGQLCVAYKEKFRKGWVTCLHAIQEHGAMTYKQLADVLVANYEFGDKQANSMARSFCMARHWLVIQKTTESIGRCPVYRITDRGREVIANKQSIPVFMWLPARNIEMDLSALPQPTWTFAASVLPDDPNEINNAAAYVEQAAPALTDTPF